MSCCSQCGSALPHLEHLCQKCYEQRHPEPLHYGTASLSRINPQWKFWIGIAADVLIAVLSFIFLFSYALTSRMPYLPVIVVFWIVATLLRLHHHASREPDVTQGQPRLPDWCLVAFCIVYSLACNWLSAFLWFARRYALFSAPVLGEMGWMVALSAVIALVAAYLTGGNWRTAMGFFVVASSALCRLIH